VITDSVIYIEAGGDGIVACFDIDYDSVFTITGGDIEIKADLNAVKIYSGELSYDGFIAIPEAAELKELYDEEYEYNYLSLADANGKIATHVIILTEKRTSKIDIEEKNSYIYNGEERLGYKGDIETDCAGALEMLYVGINGTEYHSENAPTDAGNYRLTISVPESDPVYKGSTEIDFTIEKKTLDVIWQKTGFTYDGEEKSPIVSIRGILVGDECEVKVTGAASEAGEHTATVEITNDNYRILDEDRECEFTIVDTDAVVDDTVDQITNYIFENVVKKIVRAIFGKIFAAFANI